jgi:hypothetical protein
VGAARESGRLKLCDRGVQGEPELEIGKKYKNVNVNFVCG